MTLKSPLEFKLNESNKVLTSFKVTVESFKDEIKTKIFNINGIEVCSTEIDKSSKYIIKWNLNNLKKVLSLDEIDTKYFEDDYSIRPFNASQVKEKILNYISEFVPISKM